MLRWWNADLYSGEVVGPEVEAPSLQEQELSGSKFWTFRVRVVTSPGESVAVTGNCEALGNWQPNRVLILSRESKGLDGNESVWSGRMVLPDFEDVEYRFVVVILLEPEVHKVSQKHYIVRRWETNLKPRLVYKKCRQKVQLPEPETFGFYDNKEKIERGWLTTETAIQLKLFNNAIQIWKTKLKSRHIHVKVTPINLARSNSLSVDPADDCLSLETMDLADKPEGWPVVELAVMNQVEREFRFQEQFGRECKEDDFVVFQILSDSLETIAFLVDFYSPNLKGADEEPPYHVGFSYILPSAIKNSEGQVVVPITSVKHRPIGELTVEYLKVKPISTVACDLRFSHQRQWKDSWRGLDVGHRGVGTSFKCDIRQCAEVRENTIASLKAAASHGADFVEFDVQLSKDLIPVLYHDFYVGIAMKRKKQITPEEMIQLPVKDLSLEQLHLLKLYHVKEQGGQNKYSDEHLEDHQPFPTLQQALEVLDPSVGFDIEIKWTMQLKDGTYELYHPFDLNLYLDTVLDVVLKHGGARNIIFSCFHPDICSMIRLKQNKYPVMFLTQGITDKYPAYHDPRCQSIPMAVNYAKSMDILGVNVHTEDLLRDSSQVALVKMAGLVLFCWGDDNNDQETIKHLKELGIHAVIYDKIDQISNKEVKESIFRLEARESERVLIKAAAEKACTDDLHYHGSNEILIPTVPDNLQYGGGNCSVATLASTWSRSSDGISNSSRNVSDKSLESLGEERSTGKMVLPEGSSKNDCLPPCSLHGNLLPEAS